MSEILQLCGALGIRLKSLKNFARRIVEAYLRGDLDKSDRSHRKSYTLKDVQAITGYRNYNDLWHYLLALTLSRIDLGEFLNDPRAAGLRVKFLGVGFGHCELTSVEDKILDFQDSFEKLLEYLEPEYSKPPYPVFEPKIFKLIRIRFENMRKLPKLETMFLSFPPRFTSKQRDHQKAEEIRRAEDELLQAYYRKVEGS